MTSINYPIGGYAPGNYNCQCTTCKAEFTGDKRAVQCEPCGVNTLLDSYIALVIAHQRLAARYGQVLSDLAATRRTLLVIEPDIEHKLGMTHE